MKMTKHWTNALPLTLLLLVSTIHSREAIASERRLIASSFASVTAEPRIDSAFLFLLRLGDQVEIIDIKESFSKIRYIFEGEFPFEGWIPTAALVPTTSDPENPAFQRKGQMYEPIPKSEKIPHKAFESLNAPLRRGPVLENTQDLASSNTTQIEGSPDTSSHFIPSSWNPAFSIELSSVNYQEQLKTLNVNSPTSGYYPGSFLSYELNGAALSTEGRLGFDFSTQQVGAFLRYSFIYFSDGISGNSYINTSNLQALVHLIQAGPTYKSNFYLGSGWSIAPEVRLFAQYFNLTTNQLSDSRQNQPVLMSLSQLEGRLEIRSRLEIPYDHLFFEPQFGMSLFSSFSETPNITVDSNGNSLAEENQIRTGSPSSKILQFHLGASLGLKLSDWGMPATEIFFRGTYDDLSRKYSGRGNRAGFKVSEVESKTTMTQLTLGLRRFF